MGLLNPAGDEHSLADQQIINDSGAKCSQLYLWRFFCCHQIIFAVVLFAAILFFYLINLQP